MFETHALQFQPVHLAAKKRLLGLGFVQLLFEPDQHLILSAKLVFQLVDDDSQFSDAPALGENTPVEGRAAAAGNRQR